MRSSSGRRRTREPLGFVVPMRVAFGAICVAAVLAIGLPLRGALDLRSSQTDAARGDLDSALSEANDASNAQPYAAAPLIQLALVRELKGDYDGAARFARQATDKEPENWKNWAVLARLEARNGNDRAAIEAYKRARELHPTILGAPA